MHLCSLFCLPVSLSACRQSLSDWTKVGASIVSVRPISVIRFWISEGLTQAESLNLKGWNSHAHRELPGNPESTNLSRDNLSREIGRTGCCREGFTCPGTGVRLPGSESGGDAEERFYAPPPPGNNFWDCKCARIETTASIHHPLWVVVMLVYKIVFSPRKDAASRSLPAKGQT